MRESDTIAAISTAPGTGAIGILRVSGQLTKGICSQVLTPIRSQEHPSQSLLQKPRMAVYCNFRDPAGQGKVLDRILCLYFQNPHSYTGEDMAEFQFHGNPILLREALEVLYRLGARPALPGEFSKRAYLNGKMALTEAEAVARLIHARSRFELELAQKNLFGEISKLSSRLRSELIGIKAEFEAEIDFSTEDLTYESTQARLERIEKIQELCESLLKKSSRADALIGRSKVVLFGEPNVGKSSLMNRLLGRDRSIISDVPGTTRDYISEDLNLSGIPIRLVDTAGVRDTEDSIEKKGIEQSIREAENADIKLFLIDASEDRDWKEFADKNSQYLESSLLIANKIDAKHRSYDRRIFCDRFPDLEIQEISCKTGEGVECLLESLEKRLAQSEDSSEYVVLEDRHKYHFQEMVVCLQKAKELVQESAPAEIAIKEIDEAIHHVGQINGVVGTEEILGRIFSVFCVGK